MRKVFDGPFGRPFDFGSRLRNGDGEGRGRPSVGDDADRFEIGASGASLGEHGLGPDSDPGARAAAAREAMADRMRRRREEKSDEEETTDGTASAKPDRSSDNKDDGGGPPIGKGWRKDGGTTDDGTTDDGTTDGGTTDGGTTDGGTTDGGTTDGGTTDGGTTDGGTTDGGTTDGGTTDGGTTDGGTTDDGTTDGGTTDGGTTDGGTTDGGTTDDGTTAGGPTDAGTTDGGTTDGGTTDGGTTDGGTTDDGTTDGGTTDGGTTDGGTTDGGTTDGGTTDGGTTDGGTTDDGTTGTDPADGFDIDFAFSGFDGQYAGLVDAFTNAAAILEGIILADLPDMTFWSGETIDDVLISASLISIDGSYGVLGRAGPTAIRSDIKLPSKGMMEFDTADATRLDTEGKWEAVIIHEMLHVLGMGTLWGDGLLDLATGEGTSDARFTGVNGNAAYIAGVQDGSIDRK